MIFFVLAVNHVSRVVKGAVALSIADQMRYVRLKPKCCISSGACHQV